MICRACIDLLCTNLSKDEQLKARKNSEKKQLDKCKQPGIPIQAIFFFYKINAKHSPFQFHLYEHTIEKGLRQDQIKNSKY